MANVIQVTVEGVDKASTVVNKISGSLTSFVKVAGSVGVAFSGVATAIVAMTSKYASMEEAVGNAAARLGTSAEELSKWQEVVKRADVDAGAFTMSLQFLQRNAANAAAGVGESAKVFDLLGISVKQFQTIPIGDQLKLVNERMGTLKTQGERVSVAMQLFGRSGAQMLQVLTGNNEELRRQEERMIRLGAVISTQAVENANKFNDSMDDMQTALNGVGRAMADQLTGPLSVIFARVAESVADMGPAIKEFTSTAVRDIMVFGIVVAQIYDDMKKDLTDALDNETLKAATGWLVPWMRAIWDRTVDDAAAAWGAIAKNVKFYGGLIIDYGGYIAKTFATFFINDILYVVNAISALVKSGWALIKGEGTEGARAAAAASFAEMDAAMERERKQYESFGATVEANAKRTADIAAQYRDAAFGVDTVSGPQPQTDSDAPKTFADRWRAATDQVNAMLSQYSSNANAANESVAAGAGRALSETEAWAAGAGAALGDPMQAYYDNFKNTTSAVLSEAEAWGAGMGAALGDPMLQYYADLNTAIELRRQNETTFMGELSTLWAMYYESQGTLVEDLARESYDIMQRTIDGISAGISSVIVNGQNMLTVFRGVLKTLLASIIETLVEVALERMVMNKIFAAANVKETAAQTSSAAFKGSANMFASMAGAPFPINLTAPAKAASTFAAISALGLKATAAAVAGIAHGGLTNVPSEATYLLNKGERVLSPRQNQDLSDFMSDGGSGSGVVIQNLTVTVLPNATNADALLRLTPKEMEDVVAGPILRALNNLSRKGVKMSYLETGVLR